MRKVRSRVRLQVRITRKISLQENLDIVSLYHCVSIFKYSTWSPQKVHIEAGNRARVGQRSIFRQARIGKEHMQTFQFHLARIQGSEAWRLTFCAQKTNSLVLTYSWALLSLKRCSCDKKYLQKHISTNYSSFLLKTNNSFIEEDRQCTDAFQLRSQTKHDITRSTLNSIA